MPQGRSVGRPGSSPLMKLPSRPAASPRGTSGATKSIVVIQRSFRRPQKIAMAMSTPRKPPWKLMPPAQICRISAGWSR